MDHSVHGEEKTIKKLMRIKMVLCSFLMMWNCLLTYDMMTAICKQYL